MDDLLAEYGAAIGSVAYLIVRNAADAEEIVMDTLVIAWRNASQLRDDGALRTWLLRIATRQALSRRRQRKVTQPLEFAMALPGKGEPSLDRVFVADMLGALPARQRAAVALHHVAGLTVAQTAEAMGVSQNTAKTHPWDAFLYGWQYLPTNLIMYSGVSLLFGLPFALLVAVPSAHLLSGLRPHAAHLVTPSVLVLCADAVLILFMIPSVMRALRTMD